MIPVREAKIGDLPAISALAGLLDSSGFQNAPTVFNAPGDPFRSAEWLEEQLSASNIRVFVAVDDAGEVVGFARAHIGPTPKSLAMKAQTIGWMHELVVEPADQARKTGAALLDAIDSWLVSEGVTQVRATVWPFQQDAINVFEDHGYRVMSQNLLCDLES